MGFIIMMCVVGLFFFTYYFAPHVERFLTKYVLGIFRKEDEDE